MTFAPHVTRALFALTSAVALTAALAVPGAARAQSAHDGAVVASPRPFSSNDLLWLEVRADDALLTESMDAYASRAGVYLPLGQFARVLDLAIVVNPEQKRAEGWLLEKSRTFELDLARHTALVGGKEIHFTDEQAAAYEDDIYVRLDLIEQLLPLKTKADVAAQLLRITPSEPLPFQQRLALEGRRRDLAAGGDPNEALVARPPPYLAFSPPAFDVNVGGQIARDGRDQSRRYDLRAAGDLAYAGFQGFLGSDDHGKLNDVRVLLERRDQGGKALAGLGPLGGLQATRVGVGDIFAPASALGPSSFAGRGVFYSSAPLEALDLSTPLDLRGELAVGEEVELYVNETLRGSQATPVEGRYAFLDVPLAIGLNTIRLVFYGSQGQRREETRRINVGAGQAAPGALVLRFAALQQGRSVIDPVIDRSDPSVADPRVILLADYGISPTLTLSGGAARFTPLGLAPRSTVMGGVRASMAGAALQADLAADGDAGRAASLAVAARPFGLSVTARHSQYDGGFIDETRQVLTTDSTRLRQASEANASGSVQISDSLVFPIAVDWRQVVRVDGSSRTTTEARSSAALGRYYFSGTVFHDMEQTGAFSRDELGGRLDVATLISSTVQFRGGVSYHTESNLGFDSAYGSLDIRLPHGDALHLGAIRTGAGGDTSLQASYLRRTRAVDIAANASYETGAGEWRIGLQLGFAFGYDPTVGGYRFAPPGAAATGTAVVNAFVDANGDGRRQIDEAPVAGMKIDTPSGPVVTDAKGHAFATGLGDGGKVRLRVNADDLDDPFIVGGPAVLAVAPRIGRTSVVDYPMARRSEVELTVMLQRSGDVTLRPLAAVNLRPLAAVNLELVSESGGATLAARTDHAGVGFFEGVPSGRYLVRLQPDQAALLGLSLTVAPAVLVPEKGGYVSGGKLVVRFKRDAQ